ncbi:dynamin family protein [Aerosakkonemataceae cyanobacterium BLCC-F46]|uniref:Dynamin family protein n=2 Tax=Floridanema TaxID=3396149 RepID=A0ABV4X3X1_9CYAN
MNKSLITPQTVELVSRLTGQKLSKEDMSPPVVFLVALVTVLLGVIYADGTVSAEETQRMRTTLAELIPANNSLRQLVMLMAKGVKENQFYKNLPEFLALTACFSESEKLLLISFGYQMSAADGTIDKREKEYLKIIAKRLEVDDRYLTILEASFSSQVIRDTAALDEVYLLLDPAQFQSLDSLFVRAASHIIEHLPAKPKPQINQKVLVSSYQELKKFQEYREQLKGVCDRLNQIITDGHERAVITDDLAGKIKETSDKLQSQCFRVVVVGEFSKGKSTLLNALLGEEIQPVRDLPCSGTVTILKYGSEKRVICRYKDGRDEEEISPEQYQEKASISEEAALVSAEDEIAKSEIAEIVFEHPELELCRNGVEIIDSPGLNEAEERTLVTQEVLKKADAVIFLTHAQSVLTNKEQELLKDLKKELNYGKEDEGAKNIFVVVNFFDLLRGEVSRKQIRQRAEKIVQEKNQIIAGENRIHFISAQSALDAVLSGRQNDEYLKTFQAFTSSLEKFLTVERGAISLKQSAAGLKKIIDISCAELNQKREILDGKLTLSQQDKPKIFEQMAQVSGRDVKIRVLAEELREKSLDETLESWNEWVEGLAERLIAKSNRWTSEHGHIMGQDKLTKDYANQFVRDITQEIENWGNQKVQAIVRQNMAVLEKQLTEDIYAIRQDFEKFDKQKSSNLVAQFNNLAIASNFGGIGTSGSGIASSISEVEDGGFFGGLGIGAAVGAALLFFTGLGFIGVILGALAAGAGGGLGWSWLDGDSVKAQIREKVCELGLEKFNESADSIFEKVQEKIIDGFEERIKASNGVMKEAMLLWENLLEDQEKRDRQSQEECDAEKVWIENKRQELLQVEKEIETILPSVG